MIRGGLTAWNMDDKMKPPFVDGDLAAQLKAAFINALMMVGVSVGVLWLFISNGPFPLKTDMDHQTEELRQRISEDEARTTDLQAELAKQIQQNTQSIAVVQDNQANMSDDIIQLQQYQLDLQGKPYVPLQPRHKRSML